MKVIVVLHDVSSSNRIVDFSRTLTNFKNSIKLVVFSRVTGGAAQYGLAEASKILYKDDIPFLIVSDLKELEELSLLKGQVIQVSRSFGRPVKSFEEVLSSKEALEDTTLVLSGSDTGFGRSELLSEATIVYPDILSREVSPEVYLVLFMRDLSHRV